MAFRKQISSINLVNSKAGVDFAVDDAGTGFPTITVRNQGGTVIGSAVYSIGPDFSEERLVVGPNFLGDMNGVDGWRVQMQAGAPVVTKGGVTYTLMPA